MHDGTLAKKHALSKTSLVENFVLKQIDLSSTVKFFMLVKLPSKANLLLTLRIGQTKLIALSVSLIILVVAIVLYHSKICLHRQN